MYRILFQTAVLSFFIVLVGCGSVETPAALAEGSAAAATEDASGDTAPKTNAAPGKAKSGNFDGIPKAYDWVNDFANMIEDEKEATFVKKIKEYEQKTSNEIAIVTLEEIPANLDIETYTKNLGNYWGVGKKGVDNGLIILVTKKDRKIRIATGLGLKEIISDQDAQQIIDEIIIPAFKKEQMEMGLDQAINKIISILPVNKK